LFVVWHYRKSPSQFATYQAKKLADELDIGLSNLPAKIALGKKNVEVRAFEANKGDFVSSYINNRGIDGAVPIAIGDDTTDEDMFKTLRSKGLTVKVGPEDTQAEYRIGEQTDIVQLLELLIKI
jgi:trehalose 6-phosphate synthase/phosphatase